MKKKYDSENDQNQKRQDCDYHGVVICDHIDWSGSLYGLTEYSYTHNNTFYENLRICKIMIRYSGLWILTCCVYQREKEFVMAHAEVSLSALV